MPPNDTFLYCLQEIQFECLNININLFNNTSYDNHFLHNFLRYKYHHKRKMEFKIFKKAYFKINIQ